METKIKISNENDKKISEFMGVEINPKVCVLDCDGDFVYSIDYESIEDYAKVNPDDLFVPFFIEVNYNYPKYSEDLNLLFQVVDKIESEYLFGFYFQSNQYENDYKFKFLTEYFSLSGRADTKIKALCDAVLSFIDNIDLIKTLEQNQIDGLSVIPLFSGVKE